MSKLKFDELSTDINSDAIAKEMEENRVFWLMGMGYSLSQIELILKFDGFFVDGVYNE